MSIVKTHFDGKKSMEILKLAQLAEAAERYEDMTAFMKAFVLGVLADKQGLDVEGRNLLSVAYKNVVGQLRSSWRTLSNPELLEGDPKEAPDAEDVKKYKAIVEKQLETVCQDVLDLLENNLLKAPEEDDKDKEKEKTKEYWETQVFYKKMVGDYYRYLCEFAEEGSDKMKKQKEQCAKWYMEAQDNAEALMETHPTRLGIALNFSVCQYEILKDKKKACEIAKKAFDAAVDKLDRLNDASYKDSTMIMQLLRDNLTLWTSAEDGDEPEN